MLSNVLYHKDKTNIILMNWVRKNKFKIINYNEKARGHRKEIIIINYEVQNESLC